MSEKRATQKNKDIFRKLSKKWPSVKIVEKLLQPDPAIDKWIIDVLEDIATVEDFCCPKCTWAYVHLIRAAGAKKLAAAAGLLIKIFEKYCDYDYPFVIDSVLVAIESLGGEALIPLIKAFDTAKDDDFKTTYLGLLSKLGVKDKRIGEALIHNYNLNSTYIADCIANYGDKALLPFLYDKICAIVPELKKILPVTGDNPEELELYFALRSAVAELEYNCLSGFVSQSLFDFYKQKGNSFDDTSPDLEKDFIQYEETTEKLDRQFLGDDVKIYGKDRHHNEDGFDYNDECEAEDDYEDYDDEEDGNMPELNSGTPFTRDYPKIGRNDPCPCGSGKKYKKCCFDKMH